jgi:hypothetical protein
MGTVIDNDLCVLKLVCGALPYLTTTPYTLQSTTADFPTPSDIVSYLHHVSFLRS